MPYSLRIGSATPQSDSDDGISTTPIGDRDATLQANRVRPTSLEYDLHEPDFFLGVLLSPRVILVEDRGELTGLVTVKDVLRFIAMEKLDHSPSWDERGGLDGLLEEVWTWATDLTHRVVLWSRSLIRR